MVEDDEEVQNDAPFDEPSAGADLGAQNAEDKAAEDDAAEDDHSDDAGADA